VAKVQNRSTKNDPVLEALPLACADEKAAVEFMEKQRWNGHPACPRCGSVNVYAMTNAETGERQENFRWRCREKHPAQQFTVRVGTVFEDSAIPMRHWCFAFWRAATSKKGVSALEIHRQTGVSYKSSLFMLHRIRHAMADSAPDMLSGPVEVDETYVGGKPRFKGKNKRGHGTKKQPVMAMVERGGKVKTKPVANITAKTLKQVIRDNVHPSATILSDENSAYIGIGNEFAGGHHTVKHGKREYVRGDVHSNTIEGFFSLLKRGLIGIYHNVSKEHLHRYLCEYEFRYNNRELDDGDRTVAAIRAADGKRLFYKAPAQGLQ
jgi:transposase-like protein